MPFIDELLCFTNDIFVETGTYQGDTIHRVAYNGVFRPSKIFSLELSEVFYNRCVQRFKNIPKYFSDIQLCKANSKYELYNIIKNLPSEITFWLDSHWSGVADIGCDPETICPILFELDQIKEHSIKTHTIMIDDIRLMDGCHFPVTLDQIISKIYEINPKYTIKFYDDNESKNDILVAYVQEKNMYP
jgi:hypothetical protein